MQAGAMQAGAVPAGPEQPVLPPAGDGQKVPLARYVEPPAIAAERPMIPPTGMVPAVPAAAPPGGRQQGGMAAQAGGDRYDFHAQQVTRQRDRLLRKAASTKTRARWLTWTGLLLLVAGAAMFVTADLKYIKQLSKSIRYGTAPAPSLGHFGGHPIAGVPVGLLGWGLAAMGAVLLIFGIVCHVMAGSRRRRVNRDFPMPVQ
jgi:hypothetical protein